MPIVSISMSDKMLKQMDGLVGEQGFAGRSDAVRAGLRLLISEGRQVEKISGKVKSVLIVSHDKKSEHNLMEARHEFEDIISTHLHTSLEPDKCLEVFIVEADAKATKNFIKNIQSKSKTEYVRLVTP